MGGVLRLAGLRWGAIALLALAAALLCAVTPAHAAAPLPPSALATAPSAAVPPALQALEAKMAQLRVNSERYLRLISGTQVVESSSPPGHRHRRRVPVRIQQLGEVSLSPAVAELFGGADMTEPEVIVVGLTLYDHVPKGAVRYCGRSWVRHSHELSAADLFPFHGSSLEVNLGGSGSYAGLLNLLATATGEISTVGPATVEGQATTEFTAHLQPLLLIRGLSSKEQTIAREHSPAVTLTVFIAESGLPARVVIQVGNGASLFTQTTQVLATDVPVPVKAPPSRETASPREYGETGHRAVPPLPCPKSKQ